MDLLNTALCWIILFAKVVTMQSLKCDAGEYEINNECCPMCPPGSVVRSHCTTDSSTVCVPCITQTYMDHPNGVSKCLRCKICDKGAALVTQKGCTYNSNTICECEAGHFCPEEDGKECNLCQQHTICQPGEWVEKLGTARTNTMCEICPLDTFSNESMSKTCIPWRNYRRTYRSKE
ncbi:tumor necrosis factor receptor superfamily member 14 isoform X2 [Ascaphus truei]|uniref:tumor necrosis factor receptor superfamily member 14 isoform X2 n=1 Tax=Ascaphus truei TaxID=8439 RepID=UPI003F59A8E1